MELPFFDSTKLDELLPMPDAVAALESVFGAAEPPTAPPRQHLDAGAGELLVMPCSSSHGTGVKLVTVARDNPARGLPLIHGVYVLFSPDALVPVAVFDGAAITTLRTAAVSALATKYLARTDGTRLVVFGAGVQAEAHIRAIRCVRPVEEVAIVSRTRSRAEELAARVGARATGPDAVLGADIVCTCTTSATPVFDGSMLRPGSHVNAVGAYKPDKRELDDAAVSRARIVVESKSSALSEAGDLVIPLARGVISEDAVEELAAVVRSRAPRRVDDITIFKSVGVAFEDLAIATAVYQRA